MYYFDTYRKCATHKLTVSFAHVCEGQQTMTTLSGAETATYDILHVSATDHGPIELKLTYNNQTLQFLSGNGVLGSQKLRSLLRAQS